MVTFAVTITIPDNEIANDLIGLQRIYPNTAGDTNLIYVKKTVQTVMAGVCKNGLDLIQKETLAATNPNITTS